MNLPYNYTLWNGSHVDFSKTFAVDLGWKQEPVRLSYSVESLKAVSPKYATIVLHAEGGLDGGAQHKNNLGLAPFVFAWSETAEPPTREFTSFGGFSFKTLDWFIAGKVCSHCGSSLVADTLDVDAAISRMLGAVDINDDGLEEMEKIGWTDTPREKAMKEYIATKRLHPGKSYYFHAYRLGGNGLFDSSGFHPGAIAANGEKTESASFINSDIVTIGPIKMPL